MTSGNYLLLFSGTVLFFSVSPLWNNVTDTGGARTWHGGTGFL